MIKLSVLIPTVHTRRSTFLPKILDQIYNQYDKLTKDQQSKVEILILQDNKTSMLGQKRNSMIDIAQGKYVQFVDDDDRIEKTFLHDLLKATESNADVITFDVSVTLNGGTSKICKYSKDYPKDYNTREGYFRIPNHICCVKRSISQMVSFPNIKYGEDAVYAKLLKPLLRTEYRIEKVLYHYDYNELTTEAQEDHEAVIQKRESLAPAIADVIILSNAKNQTLRRLTQQSIDTAIAGANGLKINVIVIEQSTGVNYRNAQLIYHNAEFNYNAFCNLGARNCSSPLIVFANNDLIFKNSWLHNLIAADHPIVSPKCPNDTRQTMMIKNTTGIENGTHFSGWCFMISRDLYDKIGYFDECVNFWFSDDCVIEQSLIQGVKPMIVPSSNVVHLGSTTFKTLDSQKMNDYTWGQCEIFNKKYNRNKFHDNPYYKEWREINA